MRAYVRARVKLMVIESISNSKVKLLRSLYTKKGRIESNMFVVEGVNMVRDIPSQIEVVYYFVNEKKQDLLNSFDTSKYAEIVVLSDSLFERVCETVTPSGLIAVCKIPYPSNYSVSKRIIILDGVSDMGNVGTIIRTAGACGFETALLFNSADPYAPKCVRSTMGGIFRVNVVSLEYEQFEWDGDVYLLDMDGVNIFDEIPSDKYAIVVGSEAKGAGDYFRNRSNKIMSIPMQNNTESLNAGVSASLSMYILEHNRRS